MKSIFVIGDSFCFHRTQHDDWPVVLANRINAKLIGDGYRGQHWWFIREQFLKMLRGIKFEDIELFVFCHTDPHRIVGTEKTIEYTESDMPLVKTYLTNLENKSYNNWCCEKWFEECNKIFDNQKVIHIQNFPTTKSYFGILNGVKLEFSNLCEIAQQDGGNFNQDRNHFTTIRNIQVGNRLFDIWNTYKNTWPKSLTESW